MSSERLGEPKTNRAMFSLLARAGWMEDSMVAVMGKVVGLRNILVHGYADVDVTVIREVVTHRLGDLQAFVASIRAKLGEPAKE